MTLHKYNIHDNGGTPFNVEINGKSVKIYKNMGDSLNTFSLLDEIKVNKVFIGKKSPTGGYDGLSSSKGDGNSILLEVANSYIYIGHEIYEFSPIKDDIIVKYYSDIGNNDVPYPYAIGKTHIYFMLNKEAVEISYFNMKKNIYEQYYYEHRIKMCLFGNPKSDICNNKSIYGPKVKEFKEKKCKLKTKLIHKGNLY